MPSTHRLSVLLTDPEQRAALAAARTLGRGGYRVHTIGETRGLAGRSRYVERHHGLQNGVAKRPLAMREAVAAVVKAANVQVVIPVTDTASRALLGSDGLLGAAVAGPSPDAYARASDKAELLRSAHACGLRVPRQVELLHAHRQLIGDVGIEFPLVVKPSQSVVSVGDRNVTTSVQFADDPSELATILAGTPVEAYPLLLQEKIVGEGVGVFLLRTHGATQLVFAHRRLREKPPSGGVSTYREAIVPPSALVERCETLLDHLRYEGAAMVEFKHSTATGEYVLMEINARLWGSVQLAIDAGIDFPRAMVQIALGEPITGPHAVKSGTRTVWELGEVDHALAILRRSAQELHLPSTHPVGALAAVGALLDHRLSDRCEVFRLVDPLPFFAELLRWLAGR